MTWDGVNWRGGLLRIWIVLSVLWTASLWFNVYSNVVPEALDDYYADKPDVTGLMTRAEVEKKYCKDQSEEEICRLAKFGMWGYTKERSILMWEAGKREATSVLSNASLTMFAPPALMLLLGFAGGWAVKGFRKK